MRSVLDRDSEHLLPRDNVFMLALAVSPEWVPDVFLVFFFFFLCSGPEARRLGETSRCCANHQIIHTNRHHLMSRTTPSKRNYIHLNLSSPSAKETRERKKKPVYLQFTANANRKDKSGTCASYYECTLLCVMSAACIIQGGGEEGVPYLCPLYL